jgi:DNA-binding NarL/FixJ family response regulator
MELAGKPRRPTGRGLECRDGGEVIDLADRSPGRRTRPLRLLIVRGHTLFAESLRVGLGYEGIETVGIVADFGPEVMLVAETRADIVLVDLDSRVDASALPLIASLVGQGARVVGITGSEDERTQAQALESGATAVVSKTDSLDRLVEIIEDVAAGVSTPAASTGHELLHALAKRREAERARLEPFTRLSRRERDVLARLIEGDTAAQIAVRDVVSITTVRTHIRRVLAKLGVKSQLAAVALARQMSWMPDSEPEPFAASMG